MKKSKLIKNAKGITLVALVVTIVILLILAGVTITMTLGQNGLFTRAKAVIKEYEQAEVREDLSMLITQYTLDKESEKTDKSLGDHLKDNGATSVKANSDGTTLEVEYKGYVFAVNKDSGEITSVSKAGPRPQVSGVKVTEDSAGQGNNVEQGKIAADSGKKLYITFTSSIEGGTTTVSPAVPYEVSKNGSYKFTITGTVGEKTYSLEYTVTINQYKVKTPQVGDIVSYTPDTPSTGYDLSTAKSGYSSAQTIDGTYDPTTWKIMEVDESGNVTKLLGIGSKTITFQGSTGYNNGVYLLNDICKSRYGNASLGATARSLTIEDIESRMNSNGIAARNANKGYNNTGTTQYGATRKYTGSNAKYPALYEQEKYAGVHRDAQGNLVEVSDVADGTQVITGSVNASAQANMNPNGKTQSEDVYTATTTDTSKTDATTLTCTQTYYRFDSTPSSYFDDTNFHSMIFGTGTNFWLASRYVNCHSNYSCANFGLRNVYNSSLDGGSLFDSDGANYTCTYHLAPVVSLGSGVQIKSGEGTTEKPYVIGK